jgi:hypothetical protein
MLLELLLAPEDSSAVVYRREGPEREGANLGLDVIYCKRNLFGHQKASRTTAAQLIVPKISFQ